MSRAAQHASLDAALRAAERRVRETGRTQWIGLPAEIRPADTLSLFAASGDGDRFLLDRPAHGLQVIGLGAQRTLTGDGASRFEKTTPEARALAEDAHTVQPDPRPPAPPLLVGGFAFADGGARGEWSAFGPARLTLPELSSIRREGLVTTVVWQPFEPGQSADDVAGRGARCAARWQERARGAGLAAEAPSARASEFHARSDAPHQAYVDLVARALTAIGDGAFQKVVAARSVTLSRPGGFEAARVVAELRRAHPSCTSFAIAREGSAFVGATPELLVRLVGRSVETAAVAGSAPRGRSPEEDGRLGRALAESGKEQREHALVVRAVGETLADLCDGITLPDAPRLLRLEGIQHLETPISARLRGGRTLLELVARMHPTPAVGGTPRRAALDWLEDHEGLERGWYAGPVGFVDAEGGGEFCVALRSALLHGEAAHLYAGAGIVAGSDPAAELRETQLKLRAMLGALVEL
jgi:isochorismate synthase